MSLKNIIMQHYEGSNKPEEILASIENIKRYADKCNAEYLLLDGYPFNKKSKLYLSKACST